MKRFLFGMDAERPGDCARLLRRKGIDAVVLGDADARTREALAENGLMLYLCYGAHGLGGDFADPVHLARDAEGREARWFSSGCPNDVALARARMDAALERAANLPEMRGILVDGARFASFASTEGPDGFFSCFCPRCMERMEALGLDAARIRRAVRRLGSERRITDEAAIAGWFAFRADCVGAYLEDFAGRVHALPGSPEAGAFVFAPSLAGFVGQTARACAPLDLVSPMLYRAYPHADGPACLGHEWAAASRLFEPEVLRRLAELSGADAGFVPRQEPDALLAKGFAPERIGAEIAAARLRPGQSLLPILQIEDRQIMRSVCSALEADADGFGYFMYGQAPLEALPEFF